MVDGGSQCGAPEPRVAVGRAATPAPETREPRCQRCCTPIPPDCPQCHRDQPFRDYIYNTDYELRIMEGALAGLLAERYHSIPRTTIAIFIFFFCTGFQYMVLQLTKTPEECYENLKCEAWPRRYNVKNWNAVLSNIVYLIVGFFLLLFIAVQAKRQEVLYKGKICKLRAPPSIAAGRGRELVQVILCHNKAQSGLAINACLSLICEGFLSGLYHACPTQKNSQFDYIGITMVATHSAALQQVARPLYDNPTLPRDGRAAIVLRGQAFRCWLEGELPDGEHRLPCCGAAIPAQEAATASLVKHVVQPLEALGNKVEIVVTDGECNLTAGSIISQLGGRVLRFEQRTALGPYPQNENVRFALEAFKAAVPGGSERIAERYDLVLVLRHDTTWKLPIGQWHEANFSKFNFASRCDLEAWDSCINDVFQTMPGPLFPAFDGEVGREECFSVPDPSRCAGLPFCIWNSGHFCAAQVRARMGWRRVGVVTQWRPESRVRDPNEIWELYTV